MIPKETVVLAYPFEVIMTRRTTKGPDGGPVVFRVVMSMYGVEAGDIREQIFQAPRGQVFQPGHVADKVESVRVQLESIYGVPYKVSKVGGLGLTGNVYYHIFPDTGRKPRLVRA